VILASGAWAGTIHSGLRRKKDKAKAEPATSKSSLKRGEGTLSGFETPLIGEQTPREKERCSHRGRIARSWTGDSEKPEEKEASWALCQFP